MEAEPKVKKWKLHLATYKNIQLLHVGHGHVWAICQPTRFYVQLQSANFAE
jgi:hypothetical protein